MSHDLTVYSTHGVVQTLTREQCCQVAEIPAKKLKRGRRKKKLAERICGRILADFTKKWQKRGRKKFLKEVPYF
jgi:hypothetical protein